ncbi:MipA/OmpV family protein [Aquidulcibacter sp.]|uniref:MipA/OmpV family protein n=1 Tax=Aquidulcibacter sp. TaxID=2052990 RepID=UPI0025C43B36|nr:MipA/OmpV family protein [Aquidulcibacter sp.]MCA3694716.1 MipA/OmpV family protein [Aquidulcibacter sp.]
MKYAQLSLILALSFAAFIPSAQADEAKRNSLTLGAMQIPEFEGSKDTETWPLIAGSYHFDERFIALEGTAIRANLVNSENWRAGPVLNYRFGRDKDVKDVAIRALGPVKDAWETGAYAGYVMPVGAGTIGITGEVLTDASDVHKGWTGSASVRYSRAITPAFGLEVVGTASYMDKKYAQTYFGITSSQSAASSLPVYTAKSGAKDVGIDVLGSYKVTENYSVTGFVGYRRLLSEAADSPIVKRGDKDQVTFAIGITRSF